MFIKKSFINEIADSMERNLIDGAINKQAEAQIRIVKAADYLNAAAEIFDEYEMVAQAEIITAVLESLAGKKSKKKKPKTKAKAKKPATKAPSSEKMVENLKHKGWVFDESGADDRNYADDNCAMCGSDLTHRKDVMKANDQDDDLYSMLDDFKSSTDSEDFEDELDFDDFEDRVETKDPFKNYNKTYLDDDEVSVKDPFKNYNKIRI